MGPPLPFDGGSGFAGFSREAFEVFRLPDRDRRRRAIREAFHPGLEALGTDLVSKLATPGSPPLHRHVPRLDWPPGYEPFCTWLALSREPHGYQSDAQLNLGLHAEHVSIRLGWDTSVARFGRFEFLCRHGKLGEEVLRCARDGSFAIRVYASAPWPEGSRLVFEDDRDLLGAFEENRRRGVWFEVGERHPLPASFALVESRGLADRTFAVFSALLPLLDRLSGTGSEGS